MTVEYNQSEIPPDPRSGDVVLAIDAGSPIVSVAVGIGSRVVAQHSLELRESSSRLMELLDSLLRQAGLSVSDLTAVVGLEGPGSFTGLRVGFATLQGLALSLSIEAGVVSTLRVLASLESAESLPTVACVDALREEWMVQTYSLAQPTEQAHLVSADDLSSLVPANFVGFGVTRLRDQLPHEARSTFTEPGPLAGRAIELLDSGWIRWGVRELTRPSYQRPPAAHKP